MRLGIVCEGDGDGAGLRQLLVRTEVITASGITIGRVITANGRSNLTKSDGIERFFRYAAGSHDAVLIVVDADKDCPVELARDLADRVRVLAPAVPTAVVAAKSAFEAWLLADLESIAGQLIQGRVLIPASARRPEDPDEVRNAKSALSALTAKGTTYKETTDQPALASMIDIELVRERSRSFRRLLGAVSGIADAVEAGRPRVTP